MSIMFEHGERNFIAELEGEINKLKELCFEAYEILNCGDYDGNYLEITHSCSKCDSSIDRNGILRQKLKEAFMSTVNKK